MVDMLAPEVIHDQGGAVMDLGPQAGDHDVGDRDAMPFQLDEECVESAAGRDPEVRAALVGPHHLDEQPYPFVVAEQALIQVGKECSVAIDEPTT